MNRKTKETQVQITLKKSDSGGASTNVRDSWFNHMINTISKYSGLEIDVSASGDLAHHTYEDIFICYGKLIRQLVDSNHNIARIGWAVVPMDEALVMAAVDLVERPHFEGKIPDKLMQHLLRTLAMESRICLHVNVLRGEDYHHIVEGAFKAAGSAIAIALQPRKSLLSTKGSISAV